MVFWRHGRPARRGRGWRQAHAGQSVVEFAFVSLLLVLLTIGIIDFGRIVFQRTALTNAIREAARAGVVNPTSPSNLTTMRDAAARTSPSLGLTSTSTNLTADCYTWDTSTSGWVKNAANGSGNTCYQATSGNLLKVSVSYTLRPVALSLFNNMTITVNEYADVTIY